MNALSYCMFMCDVTLLDNQRQDNRAWWPDYRQENQGIGVQFSGGQKVCLFCRASRLAVQANTPIHCTPWALYPVVQRLANIVLKLRMSGEITPLPHAFKVRTVTTLFSRKLWAVHVECKRKDINSSMHIT